MSEIVAWHLFRAEQKNGILGLDWPQVDRVVTNQKAVDMAENAGMVVTPLDVEALVSLTRKFILEAMRLGTDLIVLRKAQDAAGLHWNSPDVLPPVGCPIVLRIGCAVVQAERTAHIERRDREMTYQLPGGQVLTGRYEWSYP